MDICKSQELKTLENLWQQGGVRFAFIAGKRHSGKTTLVEQFAQNKPAVCVHFYDQMLFYNICSFNQALRKANIFGDFQDFDNLHDVIQFVFNKSTEQPLILILDELQYIDKAHQSLSYFLVRLKEQLASSANLLLILTSSSMNYINKSILDKKNILHDLCTFINISPLDFFDTYQYFNTKDLETLMYVYSIFGGYLYYLKKMDITKSIKENILTNFLQRDSPLHHDAFLQVYDEFHDLTLQTGLMTAMAYDNLRRKEIDDFLHSVVDPTPYSTALTNSGFVTKYPTYGRNENKHNVYSIILPFVKFYYRYIPFVSHALESNDIDWAITYIMNDLPNMLPFMFKKVCIEWLKRQNKLNKLPIKFSDIFVSPTLNAKNDETNRLDFIISNRKLDCILCKCVWSNSDIEFSKLKKTIQLNNYIDTVGEVSTYMFTNKNFVKKCKEYVADHTSCTIVTLEDMVESICK